MAYSILHSVTDTPVQANPADLAPVVATRPNAVRLSPACDARYYVNPDSPTWHALESDHRAVLVKCGKHRKVWRVKCAREIVYAKVFDDPAGSLSHWLKRRLGLHPAAREWRALLQLESLYVPAIAAIALIHYARPNRSSRTVLLTRGIDNARTLAQEWEEIQEGPNCATTTRKQSVIAAVAHLWAKSHARGYAHPDAHPSNILVQDGDSVAGACTTCYFLDPTPARISGWVGHSLSIRVILRSLVMVDQYFHRRASRWDRLRFWREYWLQRGELLDADTERRLLTDLGAEREAHRIVLARRRDRRITGDGKYFGSLRLPDRWSGRVALSLERRHVFDERGVVDRSLDDWRFILSDFLRSRDPASLTAHGLRAFRRPVNLRGPWAREKFEHAHRLRHRDISAPLVLGYVQLRNFTSIRDEYLLVPTEKPYRRNDRSTN